MPLFVDSGRFGSAVELNAANCITIGLVNNMPDAALQATERQFVDLIRAATPNAVVLLKLFAIPELRRGDARYALDERYRDIAELWDTPLDGLIVTGAEPR
ncbi:MAG TPA: homoserine O-succinyltransferase, partial [Xanthobacteraceae bacterium]|nr:homoserine O-succinyltransferase [Xanthobacteraceae bacterium]